MPILLTFSRAVDALNKGFGWIADWLVLLAVLVSAGNAFVRYLFNYSTNGLLEVQWYMFAAMVLLGASYTLRRNEHVRVDVVYSYVSDRTRLWIDIFGFAVFFLPVMVFLTVITWPFFYLSYLIGENSINAGGLTRWPVKLMLPLGFALLTLQGLSEIIKRIAALQGRIKLDTTYDKPVQ